MGSLTQSVVTDTMIKLALLASFAAAASAQYVVAGGYPYAYGAYPYAYGYIPFGSSTGLDPITQGLDPVTQGAITKRSADADAYYAAYGYPYAYGGYAYAGVPFGSSSGLDPITQGLDPGICSILWLRLLRIRSQYCIVPLTYIFSDAR